MISLNNPNLKKIVNVYQINYINGKSPGLGDYLRGCFFLMQLCQKLGVEFDIDISNHPMSEYIINNGKSSNINYDNIEWIQGLHRPPHLFENPEPYLDVHFANNIINRANGVNNLEFGTFVSAHPIFNNFTNEGRNFIKSKLQPTQIMCDYIDITLKELNLEKNKYGIIHIRTGDRHLINKINMTSYEMERIKNVVVSKMIAERNYLLLSDNLQLKQYLKSIPNLKILIRKIEHLGGEGTKGTPNGTMNTMMEFFLMSYSNAILSLSVYNWVSGFSKWCSIINSIPLHYIKL
jgi:hypothetical protein